MGKSSTLLAAVDEVVQHCAPTGARVLEGALKIVGVLKVIIAARGAVVQGEFYRTGRRYTVRTAKATASTSPPRGRARTPTRPSHSTPASRRSTSSSWIQHARASS
jgi:hypothetical protein